MKIARRLLAAALLLVSTASLHAQGSLTPPSAPAPTMKTLTQIEPRRPVDLTNTPGTVTHLFVISEPGSYYLTRETLALNGQSGILINVDSAAGVTLDLNGFSVRGSGPDSGIAFTGISCPFPATPVTIHGGRVIGWGGDGIAITGPGVVQEVVVANCGRSGIVIGGGSTSFEDEGRLSVVRSCQVRNVRGFGITAPTGRVLESSVVQVRPTFDSAAGGILAGEVERCSVSNVVAAASTSGVTFGISANNVAQCEVRNVASGGQSVHIFAAKVTDSRVGRDVTALVSSLPDRGIEAKDVQRCTVDGLRGNTSGDVVGILAAHVRDCAVQRVANSGSGAATGIAASGLALAGNSFSETKVLHAEGNTVSGIGGRGVSGGGGTARIVGNLIRGCSGDAIGEVVGGVVANNSITIASGGSGDGIDVEDSHVNDNVVRNSGTGTGVRIAFSGVAVRNTVVGGTAFSFASGVRAGPIVAGGGSTSFDSNANVDL
jgi:hypothetical protein